MATRSSTGTVRLNRFIAQSGVCSRREADTIITEGRVHINGRRVFELGIQVDPFNDKIKLDGRLIQTESKKVYYIFHKPSGVMTTMSDPNGRKSIADYVGHIPFRVFPVGRLDWNSEGLLLLTNDGDFSNKVMHPKHEITKTYLVKVDGQPTQFQMEKLKKGVSIIGGKVRAESVSFAQVGESNKYKWIRIIITEGKNQQVRRMFEKIGFDVLRLRRVAIGQLRLGPILSGEMKSLSPRQIDRVFMTDEVSERVQKSAARKVELADGKKASYRKGPKPVKPIKRRASQSRTKKST